MTDFERNTLLKMFANDCKAEEMASFMDIPLGELYQVLYDEFGIGYGKMKRKRGGNNE